MRIFENILHPCGGLRRKQKNLKELQQSITAQAAKLEANYNFIPIKNQNDLNNFVKKIIADVCDMRIICMSSLSSRVWAPSSQAARELWSGKFFVKG